MADQISVNVDGIARQNPCMFPILMLLMLDTTEYSRCHLFGTWILSELPTRRKRKVDWVEGVAILVAITIVTVVQSVNDYQKERQFMKLNSKVSYCGAGRQCSGAADS